MNRTGLTMLIVAVVVVGLFWLYVVEQTITLTVVRATVASGADSSVVVKKRPSLVVLG